MTEIMEWKDGSKSVDLLHHFDRERLTIMRNKEGSVVSVNNQPVDDRYLKFVGNFGTDEFLEAIVSLFPDELARIQKTRKVKKRKAKT